MRRAGRVFAFLLAVLALSISAGGCGSASCGARGGGPAGADGTSGTAEETTTMTQPTESIGTATMQADGTVVLQLRAQTGPTVGDAQFSYPPSHPQYQQILDHLGGLAPGQSKPVPPWGDAQ
jgi:hypothetical protein